MIVQEIARQGGMQEHVRYRDLDHFIAKNRKKKKALLATTFHDGWQSEPLSAKIVRREERLFFKRAGERESILGRRLPSAMLEPPSNAVVNGSNGSGEFHVSFSNGEAGSVGVHQFDDWWLDFDSLFILHGGKLVSVGLDKRKKELAEFTSVNELWSGSFGLTVRVEDELYLVIT